jgi:quinol monooxygenase YgiN
MSTHVLVDMVASPGRGAELAEYLRDLAAGTQDANGFVALRLCAQADDGDHVVLIEQWRTAADYQAYTAWRHERGDLRTLRAMLAAAPRVTYLTEAWAVAAVQRRAIQREEKPDE